MKIDTEKRSSMLRNKTYENAVQLLRQYGKCAIIRPTGFGKTGLLTRIMEEYRNVLYLYPAEVVKDTVLAFFYGREDIPDDREIPGVTFMTYSKLVYMKEEEMSELPEYDLIIADECHRLGAQETQKAMDRLVERLPNAHLLGATATPDRMDLVDEIGRYFDDHITDEYTLHDAFRDGMLKKPYYIFCNYADIEANEMLVKSGTEKEIDLVGDGPEKLTLIENLKSRLIEVSNLLNMGSTIREACEKYLTSTEYMRFIVFFSGYQAIHEQGAKVKKWFHEAFPEHAIRITEVSSETDEAKSNVFTLQGMGKTEKSIDLIYCCQMLTMGYHVPGLTGIVMARGTESNICYVQMLGRALSSGAEEAGIVFDIVDNIHTQSLYSMLGKESKFTQAGRNRKMVLQAKQITSERYSSYKEAKKAGKVNEKDFTSEELEAFETYDNNPEERPCWTKNDQSELNALERRFDRDGAIVRYYDIEPKDLIVVSKEASYRDIIAKTVAEAKSMRARQAWMRWIEQGGEPYDENGRIHTRAEILALVPPEHHPLPPYCRLKQVSVNAVLDEMGVKDE